MGTLRLRSLAGALALMVVAVPVSPAAADECPPGGGTTVVVDFAGLGGGVQVGCAPTAATGFEALAQAGFKVVPVQTNAAFVCRIDGRPDPDAEDCADTPPGSAFWSYWSADRGGDWRFQVSGASGAIRGDLEGWAFATGSAAPPDYPVPAPATTTTTSTTTTSAPTTTTTHPATTTRPATTTHPATTITSPTTTITSPTTTITSPTTTITSPTTTITSPTTTGLPSTTVPEPITLASPPEAGEETGAAGGGAGGLVLGLIAVAGIGVASWIVARHRPGGDGP